MVIGQVEQRSILDVEIRTVHDPEAVALRSCDQPRIGQRSERVATPQLKVVIIEVRLHLKQVGSAQMVGQVMGSESSEVLVIGDQHRLLDTDTIEREVKIEAVERTVIGEQPLAECIPLDTMRGRHHKNRHLGGGQLVSQVDDEAIIRHQRDTVRFDLCHPRLDRNPCCGESVKRHRDDHRCKHDRDQLRDWFSALFDELVREHGGDRCSNDASRRHPRKELAVLQRHSCTQRRQPHRNRPGDKHQHSNED